MKKKNISIQAKKKATYQLKLPAETDNLELIRNFVNEIARQLPFTEEEIFHIELAVDEAATNVIQHAYKTNRRKNPIIEVKVEVFADRLEVVIGDRGVGFDPEKVQRHDVQEYLKKLKRGGLGLYIIRQLMDEVSFRVQPGKRNEVRMVKRVKAGEQDE